MAKKSKFDVEPVARIPYCTHFAFTPDGRHVLGMPQTSPARLFNCSDWKQVREFKGSPDTKIAAFSPDGKYVALAAIYMHLSVHEVRTGKLLARWKAYDNWHEADGVIVSPSTPEVVYAGPDAVIRVFDLKTGKPTRELRPTEFDASVNAIALSAKGDRLAAAWHAKYIADKWDSRVTIYSWPEGRELKSLQLFGASPAGEIDDQYEVDDLCFDPVRPELVAINGHGVIGVFDAKTGKRKRDIRQAVDKSYGRMDVSPDGKWLALSDNARLSLWKLPSGELVRDMLLDKYGSGDAIFSPDSRRLGVNVSNQIYIWDVEALAASAL